MSLEMRSIYHLLLKDEPKLLANKIDIPNWDTLYTIHIEIKIPYIFRI